jgi:hypothetical protein
MTTRVQNGRILETKEVEHDPQDIRQRLRDIRAQRAKLREKVAGHLVYDQDLANAEAALLDLLDRAQLEAPELAPLADFPR